MLYNALLIFHSYFRWLVLIGIIYTIMNAIVKHQSKQTLRKKDYILAKYTVVVSYMQGIVGLILYYLSPLVKQFYKEPASSIHLREIRFFSIEHSLMMLIALIIVTIGLKKAKNSIKGYKTIYTWFLIAIIIILLNIPWEFSPLVQRPLFR